MPRILTVSELRRSLFWAAGGPAAVGPGEGSLALLGQLFHSHFAALTGPAENFNLVRPLERADATLASWREGLVAHAYQWHVARSLVRHQASLHGHTREVLAYWRAVQELAAWLAEVMWEQRGSGRPLAQNRAEVFAGFEQEVSIELTRPGWSDSVLIEGRLDAVLRRPSTGELCAVELKLGRGAPVADLCQSALYHLHFEKLGLQAQLALLTFAPDRRERRFTADELVMAQEALVDLAGALTGVAAPSTAPAASSVASPHAALVEQVRAAFQEFGVPLRIDPEVQVGPSFLRLLAAPERGVSARRAGAVADSVWTRLRTEQPPQVSIQRGRIAIDVPRPERALVSWASIARALPRPSFRGNSAFPVGVAVDGTLKMADFALPEDSHVLVAGTAGSGKSEWLRSMIASLLVSNTTETLKLLLIDPKRTAFRAFEGKECLWRPVVHPDDQDVLEVLDALIGEMERRYRVLSELGFSDLGSYNAAAPERLPRLICVCDEYADLVAGRRQRRQEVEARVARLAQKARAAGIHLVFATQRPSREVVQGVIDANLMARVAFKVTKPLESRIVLNHPGAATLLGRGDLLFRDLGDPVRLQAPLCTDADLAKLL